jgi:hypothetical protein
MYPLIENSGSEFMGFFYHGSDVGFPVFRVVVAQMVFTQNSEGLF